MQKIMKVMVVFALVLSYSGFAGAVDGKPSLQKTKVSTKQITGEVSEIDLKTQMVSVQGKNGTVSAVLTEKTKVMMNKEARTLGDVHPGDRVTLKYREVDGKQTAKSIEIKSISKKPKLPT